MSGRPVLLTGGTGLVGRHVAARLGAIGVETRIVTRHPGPPGSNSVGWDGRHLPAETLAAAEAVVHLAGEPIFGGLPTAARRDRMWSSRVESTEAIVQTISELGAESRPRTLVCASAVGYYGDRGDEELPEIAAPGTGFLADLCVAWEAAATRAEALGVRVVRVRFGIVLSRAGGALALMSLPFRAGLGGRLGNGRQWFPWVHRDDAAAAVVHALRESTVTGALNAVSPGIVRNDEFTRELGRVLGRPTLLAVPGFAVRAALGPLSGELLGSKRVLPTAAEASGYRFERATLGEALGEELSPSATR